MSNEQKNQQPAIPLEALSLDQLKAVAFDFDEEIKMKTQILESVKQRIKVVKEQVLKQQELQKQSATKEEEGKKPVKEAVMDDKKE